MINPFKEIDWNPNLAKRRSFAISLIIGFPCLALVWLAIGWLRTSAVSVAGPAWLAAAGAAAGVVFLAIPAIVRPFYVVWYFLAACIGIIVGNILMAAVFFGVALFAGAVLAQTPAPAFDTKAKQILLVDAETAQVQRIISLQYNPDSLTRSLQIQAGGGEGGQRSEPLRFKAPAVETIKLEADIDAADQLEFPDQNRPTAENGIQPQLAVLELLAHPGSAQLLRVDSEASSGTLEIAPMLAPLPLFVIGDMLGVEPEDRPDLLRHTHKGIRSMLLHLVQKAGTTDFTDAAVLASLTADARDVFDLLELHARVEDAHILPMLRSNTPEVFQVKVDLGIPNSNLCF